MIPTPQPQQEYIISLSELKRANAFMFTNKLKELSARPHTPAPRPPCEECIYQSQAAAIAAKAREDFASAIIRGSPDTLQATEDDGDLAAWNAATIDRVLKSISTPTKVQP